MVLTSLVRKSAVLNHRIVLLKDQTSKWSESATHLHLIDCYTNIFVTPWNRVETRIKKTFYKQNGFNMSFILLCGEYVVEIIIGVKMTCQTCLYAQQVTPTSQLAFEAPLKNLRNAQQRELN